ncbi:ATP-grasp domain-containing protein [Endozoicomonas sp. ALB115]|uniref:ATP-grasp domain-containing protein n=1 Tax=Endozoicomonas sp. ALB115 TaxID=3403074 RepID=UPI003BB5A237
MVSKKKVVVLVDAYSTGAYLAPCFEEMGICSLHIQSRINLPPYFLKSHIPENYIQCLVHESIDNTLLMLQPFDIVGVIPGSDPGVHLANDLSYHLGLPAFNDPLLSEARQDKYEMIRCLSAAKLSNLKQIYTDSLEELRRWASHHSMPFVVKPRISTGVNGVVLCHSIEALETAFRSARHASTVYGVNEPKVLIQTCAKGEEYVINTVSYLGKHRMIELWRVERETNGSPILRCMELLSSNAHHEPIISYAFNVLDCLGLHNGPCHMEVILTEKGPELIEVNARMHGDMDPSAPLQVQGTNHVIETCLNFISEESKACISARQLPTATNCMKVSLRFHDEGTLSQEPSWKTLESLTSFHSLRKRTKVGQNVRPTFSVGSSAGALFLVASDREKMMDDYRKVLKWEREELSSVIEYEH